jgi:hypothetical protein
MGILEKGSWVFVVLGLGFYGAACSSETGASGGAGGLQCGQGTVAEGGYCVPLDGSADGGGAGASGTGAAGGVGGGGAGAACRMPPTTCRTLPPMRQIRPMLRKILQIRRWHASASYVKAGRYIDIAPDGTIISFGKL